MIFAIVLIALIGIATQFLVSMCLHLFGLVAATILTALILKIALAIRGMEKHAIEIINALERGDINSAQHSLSLIVRRQTKQLSREDILSATIECIGESDCRRNCCATVFLFNVGTSWSASIQDH